MDKLLLIEEGRQKDFLTFATLSEVEVQKIRDKLYRFSYGQNLSAVVDILDEFSGYYALIIGLYYAYVNLKADTTGFVQRMYNTVKQYDKENKLSEADFSRKSALLFESNNPVLQFINTIVQSAEIHSELIDVRVITEIRPIMKLGSNSEIFENKIYSYLKLSYNDRGDTDEVILSLNREALDALKVELDKAVQTYDTIYSAYVKSAEKKQN